MSVISRAFIEPCICNSYHLSFALILSTIDLDKGPENLCRLIVEQSRRMNWLDALDGVKGCQFF